MNIDPDYDLIDTDEKKKQFSPRLPTDEFWSGDSWCPVNCIIAQAEFSSFHTYRRRKQSVVQQSSQSADGWIRLKDKEPESGQWVHAYNPVENCQYITQYIGNWKDTTHWRLLPENPTPPPKDPADVAFEAAFNRANEEWRKESGDTKSFGKSLFNAGREFERKARQ